MTDTAQLGTSPTTAPISGRLRGAAAVRIAFGVIWAIDATFKWLPGFIHGQTLEKELGGASKVGTPVVHQWMQLWHAIGTANPAVFAALIAIAETVVAVCILLGAFSNAVFLGSALLSFGIWSTAEGFHLPWDRPGITDLGPSVGYIIASLALYFAAAGSVWSVDSRLRTRVGRFAWLTSPAASAV